jgi:hypothetical protein
MIHSNSIGADRFRTHLSTFSETRRTYRRPVIGTRQLFQQARFSPAEGYSFHHAPRRGVPR